MSPTVDRRGVIGMDVLLPPRAQCPVKAPPPGLSVAHAAIRAAKAALRAAVQRERVGRSEPERRAAAHALRDVVLEIPEVRAADRVAIYVARPGEPDTRPLRVALAGRGVDVVLPVIGRAAGLRWLHDGEPGGRDLHRDLYHDLRTDPCRRQVGETEVGGICDVQAVIVPALAVDTDGRRLGRGCDGYDRILRRLDRAVPVFAAVHDDELLDSAVEAVPEEPHDVRVPAAVTPSRLRVLVPDALGRPAA